MSLMTNEALTPRYADILRRHFRPLEPIATGESPVLKRLAGIRAVLFDLYGTLFISASGEVGTARQSACEAALAGSLAALEIPVSGPVGWGAEYLFGVIEASHARSRAAGIDCPEVDIVEIWREVLAELTRRGLLDAPAAEVADLKRLAVEYEARVNPCWPMPHLQECLVQLGELGRVLGIISNAQFYTVELFEALLGRRAEELGFDPELQYYSYAHGRAKPGTALFELAAGTLRRRGIAPGEAIYVGNDMLNDVFPAYKLGFRTALFAGDARSLRLRAADQQLQGISPDLVLTDLSQLLQCIIV